MIVLIIKLILMYTGGFIITFFSWYMILEQKYYDAYENNETKQTLDIWYEKNYQIKHYIITFFWPITLFYFIYYLISKISKNNKH